MAIIPKITNSYIPYSFYSSEMGILPEMDILSIFNNMEPDIFKNLNYNKFHTIFNDINNNILTIRYKDKIYTFEFIPSSPMLYLNIFNYFSGEAILHGNFWWAHSLNSKIMFFPCNFNFTFIYSANNFSLIIKKIIYGLEGFDLLDFCI